MLITAKLTIADIDIISPSYMAYFNDHEGAKWTLANVRRRLGQLIDRVDTLGLIGKDGNDLVGFAVGQLEQFDDGLVFDLNELFVASEYQGKGNGSRLLGNIEELARKEGAFRIQLIAGNDARHRHFYNDMHGYEDAGNNLIKAKAL